MRSGDSVLVRGAAVRLPAGCLADARILAQEFAPEFEARDLTNLPNHEIYVRLMVEGSVTRPFSGETVKL